MFFEIYTKLNSILLVLAIISFLPQFLRIQTKHSITGISSFYILCNLISATEQFTFYYYMLFNEYDPEGGTVFLHDPPSAGDWFSLCQTAIVSLIFLGLYEHPPVTSWLFSTYQVFSFLVSYRFCAIVTAESLQSLSTSDFSSYPSSRFG